MFLPTSIFFLYSFFYSVQFLDSICDKAKEAIRDFVRRMSLQKICMCEPSDKISDEKLMNSLIHQLCNSTLQKFLTINQSPIFAIICMVVMGFEDSMTRLQIPTNATRKSRGLSLILPCPLTHLRTQSDCARKFITLHFMDVVWGTHAQYFMKGEYKFAFCVKLMSYIA